MNIDHVIVGPYRYEIKFDKEAMDVDNKAKGKISYGIIRYAKREIIIDPSYPHDLLVTTLVHEVWHAVYELAYLDNKVSEEVMISSTSPLWVDTLRRNPELVKIIMGE